MFLLKIKYHRLFSYNANKKLGSLQYSNQKMTSSATSEKLDSEEITIPVPWGHLAAKRYGPQEKQPIVALHGWQDNYSSFDFLIPKLPRDLSFLVIDLPGHGHSSYFPPGMFYQVIDLVILLRRLQNYFDWKQLRLMGHSLGARASYEFGGMFPQCTEFIICFDALSTFVNPRKFDRVTQNVDDFLKYEKQLTNIEGRPNYYLVDLVQMFHIAGKRSVDIDKCEYLLARNIKESTTQPGKFYFTRDPRIKSGLLMNWAMEDVIEHAQRATFPILLLLAQESPRFFNHATLQKVIGVLKGHNEKFEMHVVDGKHHGHFNDPTVYAEHVTRFLKKYDSINS